MTNSDNIIFAIGVLPGTDLLMKNSKKTERKRMYIKRKSSLFLEIKKKRDINITAIPILVNIVAFPLIDYSDNTTLYYISLL